MLLHPLPRLLLLEVREALDLLRMVVDLVGLCGSRFGIGAVVGQRQGGGGIPRSAALKDVRVLLARSSEGSSLLRRCGRGL